MSPPDLDPFAGLDPVRFAAALSVLPINHPLVVAASLAVQTAHTRHDRRIAHQQASHDVSAAADWSRIAARQITYDELQARRAQPAYPTTPARVKESVVTEQPRIHSHRAAVAARIAAQEAVTERARARAAGPGYVLVGPSARTWLRDPATGLPAVEVSDEEHRAVGELLAQEIADATEPQWVTGPDGQDDIHATVTLTDHDHDHDGAAAGVFSPEQAASRMTEVGHNPADAETMVGEYLAANTARWGKPAGGWVIDTHDLAEIERSYDWVDHYRGETIAQARERAADYAQGWARTVPHVDRDHSPGYAAHVERQVRTWTDRAAGTPARAEGIYSEDPDPWAVEQDAEDWERAGVDPDAMPDPWASTTDPDLTAETDRGPGRAAREDAGPVRDGRGPDLPDVAPDLVTHGPETAARHLAAAVGDVDLPRARELVDAYLVETADRIGVSTVGWGLDRYDLDAIAAEPRVAAAHDAVTRASTEPARPGRHTEETTEQDRLAQLAAWVAADDHADDHTDMTHTTTPAGVRGHE